ncbi:unnamed protein product [Spirodela intermedia]|uniref:Annexin n=1 Tax=Spirodela intermedia TaxID=51605 RepID=A0A7I8INS7_SPIIN|nr:unnamed protein product [Spirodela intermedia]CAA6659508.1 unnamed protein product [Spirodela intermedia]
MPTLSVPAAVPSASEDAEQLYQAISGRGTKDGQIISILAHRNQNQRKLIRQVHAETYGEDLLKSLDKELSPEFEKLVLLWTLDPAERDAALAYEALRKWNPSDRVLIEIACTRTPYDLLDLRQEYREGYDISFEEDVERHITGDLRTLLPPLLTPQLVAYRYEGEAVYTDLAEIDAKTLHEHISNRAYTHEDLISVICTRSRAQLAPTFDLYLQLSGNPILKDLEADAEDEYVAALAAAVECLIWPEEYFEKVLRPAVNKLGTDEEALTRVVATRAEVDLGKVSEAYDRRNSVSLAHAVADDTSGDYQAMLLALIGHDPSF